MASPIRVLLQTTIPPIADDCHIGRFSMLGDYLAGLAGADGQPLFAVTARDRAAPGAPDPVLSTIDASDFDQLWLFRGRHRRRARDRGLRRDQPLSARGGGLLVTRDHMDLGVSVCNLGGVGMAHYFHSKHPDPDETRHVIDDRETAAILWPNYHSGANGDFQEIAVVAPPHPVLRDAAASDGLIHHLPAHPHEGAVGAPADDPTARVIATGTSKVTSRTFNLVVAFEPSESGDPAIAQSTFHHFADYNWDTAAGCPSFVDEPPGDGLTHSPEAQRAVRRYVRNVALWLAGRSAVEEVADQAGREQLGA